MAGAVMAPATNAAPSVKMMTPSRILIDPLGESTGRARDQGTARKSFQIAYISPPRRAQRGLRPGGR